MKPTRLFFLGLLCFPRICFAATVSDPSTLWNPLGANYDFMADQQTGDPASDIVGTGSDFGFFTTFNDNGNASRTDGTLGFRIRLDDHGGNSNNISFSRNAWIGMDADFDGDLDAFLGLNMQGSAAILGIYAPGAGSNTSPNTTSIANNASITYPITSSNYNYRPVNYLTDGGTTNDLTTNKSGDTDYYVSFMVAFSDVVAFLKSRSISITDQSPVRYVVATSTQSNSLNQDLGGVNGGINSNTTWTQNGGFTPVVDATGIAIPEPGPHLLAIAGILASSFIRRRIP